MKSNNHYLDYFLGIAALIVGALMLVSKYLYWELIDFLVYRGLEFGYIYVILKHYLLSFLIVLSGYDLVRVIYLLLFLVSAASLYRVASSPKNFFRYTPLLICGLFFLIGQQVGNNVNKQAVNDAFLNNKVQEVFDVDYVDLLRNEDFFTLDKNLHELEQKFINGTINEVTYRYEYSKFNKCRNGELALLEKWINISSKPEYALTVRGIIYEMLGWSARGDKWAKDTSHDQIIQMEKYFDLSISDHRQAININRKRLLSYASLINIAIALKYGSAENIYLKALTEYPESYYLHYVYMKSTEPKWGGSYKEMKRLAHEARKKAVDQPLLIALGGYEAAYRANTYWGNRDYDSAIKWYHYSLLYAPRNHIFKNIGTLYAKERKHERAISVLSDGIDYLGDDAMLLAARSKYSGLTMYAREKNEKLIEQAKRDIDIAMKLPVNDDEVLYDMAEALSSLRDPLSTQYYVKAVTVNPDNFSAYRNVLMRSYHIGYGNVLPFAEYWVKKQPDKAQHWVNYANTLVGLKDPRQEYAFKKYLELVDKKNPDNAQLIQRVEKRLKEIENEG